MKSNKKAILGMLVAMIMSLGLMTGINSQANDVSTQQLTAGSFYMATQTEGWVSAGWSITATVGVDVTKVGVATTVACGWNPIGWFSGALTVVSGL